MSEHNDNEIKTFDGGHGRVGTIKASYSICNVCGLEQEVITIDASEEEYHPGSICLNCTEEKIKEFIHNTQ